MPYKKNKNNNFGFRIKVNPKTLGVFGTYQNHGKKYEYDASLKNKDVNVNPYRTLDSPCPDGYVLVKPHKRLFFKVRGYCRRR